MVRRPPGESRRRRLRSARRGRSAPSATVAPRVEFETGGGRPPRTSSVIPPRIELLHGAAQLVGTAEQVRFGQQLERPKATRVDRPVAEQDVGERLPPVPGPFAQGDGQVMTGDRVREQPQHGHQQVTIQLIHDRPSDHGLNAGIRDRIIGRFGSGSADAGGLHGHVGGDSEFHEVQDASSQELQVAEAGGQLSGRQVPPAQDPWHAQSPQGQAGRRPGFVRPRLRSRPGPWPGRPARWPS